MELQFAPNVLEYLCVCHQESKKQEEVLETIVPDSFPDVQRILCADAHAVVRSREVYQGSAAAAGGIHARVLYMAEDEHIPRCLEMYMPFHLKIDGERLNDDSFIHFNAYVLSADVRMLNSRKLMLRANLCWDFTAYELCRQTTYVPLEPPLQLQTKNAAYDLILPAETAETSFHMEEEIRIPTGRNITGELLLTSPRLEITEKRLAGNKAVFKGLVHLRLLYDSEGKPEEFEAEIPFSQFCSLQQMYEEEELDVFADLTEFEVSRVVQEETSVRVTMGIHADCLVKCKKQVQMIEDAYCIHADFHPQWQQCNFPCRLDRQTISQTVRESKQCDIGNVLAAWAQTDTPTTMQKGETLSVVIPVTVCLLYSDKQDEVHYMSFRSEIAEEMKLSQSCSCKVFAPKVGSVNAIPTAGGAEMRFAVEATVECYADSTFQTLCGGEMEVTERNRILRPAVIVRRTRSGEPLWEIAKRNGTTVDKIREANGLDADYAETGVLLIPT